MTNTTTTVRLSSVRTDSECRALELRARQYSASVTLRAARVFDAAFGGNWAAGSNPGEVFFLAHNWEGRASNTRGQNRACRIVNGLCDQRFAARRIVDRLYHRLMRDGIRITYTS